MKETTSQRVSREWLDYSLYVLRSRHIPSITDSLKEVQRIALWLLRNAPKNKTSALVGDMMKSKLYAHGDAAAADAIGQLAAPYNNNVPLVYGDGAFGTRRQPIEGIGAPRYTSVEAAKFTEHVMYVDLDILPMKLNYDLSKTMPVHFLPLLPLVLLNGIKGIATGYATDILPRRLEDLIEATLAAIDGKPIKKLMPYWNLYDYDIQQLEDSNRYSVSGRFKRDGASRVIVTELPPRMGIEDFQTHLNELEEAEKIKDWTDASTKTISFEILFPRGAITAMTDAEIMKLLKLGTTRTENLVVLGWEGTPVTYSSAESLVQDFVDWRFLAYEKRYQNLLDKEREKLIYWYSIHACFEAKFPDEIRLIKGKKPMKERIAQIVEQAEIPVIEDNIESIAKLESYKWTEEGFETVLNNLNDSLTAIDDYEDILAKPNRRRGIFRGEVEALKKLKF